MKILLIGPQGSGKGTQGALLSKEYNIPEISAGELIRSEIAKGREFARKHASINKGNLIPDQDIADLINKRLKEKDCEKGYILDGFPRTLSQARMFDLIAEFDYVVLIDVPDKVGIERLSKRRQCRKCNKIYGLNEAPPEKCSCGGEIYQRDDDYPEAIKRRLALYHKETEPIINYYKKKGKLIKINGSGRVENVFEEIKEGLKD